MSTDLLDRATADNLAAAITSLDGVAGLDGGRFGEIALLYPGHRVQGLHVKTPASDGESARLEVFIIVDAKGQPNLAELAQTVRETVAPYSQLPVDVIMSDVN